MGKHNETGQQGEQAAADFLEKKGYQILHRNWRHKRAELDIVAMQKRTLVFVEVKTRTDYVFGRPENAVDGKKQRFYGSSSYRLHGKKWTRWGDSVRYFKPYTEGGYFLC